MDLEALIAILPKRVRVEPPDWDRLQGLFKRVVLGRYLTEDDYKVFGAAYSEDPVRYKELQAQVKASANEP